MLELGSSKPWPDAMEAITGQRGMSAQPLVDYFTPLYHWLKEQNKEENVGWSASCPTNIPVPTSTLGASSAASFSVSVLWACAVIISLFLKS